MVKVIMRKAVMSFRLHAPWVHSLKEKRMIVKSIIARLQNRFHVSAAEIEEQDTYQIIIIGVAVIIPSNAIADCRIRIRSRHRLQGGDLQT